MAWTWIKKPLNKAILVGAAILLVAVVTLLIVGITTHQEETSQRLCWENEVAVIVEGQDTTCEALTTEARWSKTTIPLHVTPMDPGGGPLPQESSGFREISAAVSELNSQFGFELLTTSPGDTDIEVQWGVASTPGGHNAPSYCEYHGHQGWVTYAVIGIRDVSSMRLTHKILLHELGHAIGLGHDDFEDSVMFPITRDDTMEEMRLDRFTDTDVAYIRSLYE